MTPFNNLFDLFLKIYVLTHLYFCFRSLQGPYMKPRALPEDARKFQNEFLSGRLENSKEGHKSFPITSDANVAIGKEGQD